MDKLIKPGRIIFAIGFSGLGILCFIFQDFIVGRPPAWPEGTTVNPVLAYISGMVLIIAVLAIIFEKEGGVAALSVAALILLLSVSRHIPHFMNDWVNAYKSMALFGGSLIIACSFLKGDSLKKYLVLAGSILLSAFFIACGYAHFKFAGFVETLIPAYIPFRAFWTYFCGICLVAGGIGILLPRTKKIAALLSGIMVLGWFLLLHIPRFIANVNDASDRMGVCESFIFAGIFFVLAGTLQGKK